MEYAVKAVERGCFFLGSGGSTDPKKQDVTHVEVFSSSQALQLPQILCDMRQHLDARQKQEKLHAIHPQAKET